MPAAAGLLPLEDSGRVKCLRGGMNQTAADLAGNEPIEQRGGVIIARLDQRYGL